MSKRKHKRKNTHKNYESKAKKEEEKQGLSYRGASLGYGDSIKSSAELYYKLYRQNTDLRRCVEELYQTVGKDGFVFRKGEDIIEKPELGDVLTNQYSINTLKSLIIRDLIVSGNVFILKLRNYANKLSGLQVLDPRTIRVVATKYGEVVGYIQTAGGNQESYTPDELYHYKDMADHDNEVLGIGKVETLVYDILGDSESSKSNYSYFKNNAVPSSIITLDNDLDENEQRLALEQLKKNFGGGENKHRISAATGVKDIKVLGSTMKDMEYAVLRAFTTERICSAIGVPKTILGYSDNVNFSTSDNQYRKFIENTIKPTANQLEEILNDILSEIDNSVEIKFLDNTDYGADEKVARLEKLIANGLMTINEGRTELNLEVYKEDYANKPLIKQGFEPLEDVGINNITEPNASE